MVIVAQLCEYVKALTRIFKWVNFTACELYFDFLNLRGIKRAKVGFGPMLGVVKASSCSLRRYPVCTV